MKKMTLGLDETDVDKTLNNVHSTVLLYFEEYGYTVILKVDLICRYSNSRLDK